MIPVEKHHHFGRLQWLCLYSWCFFDGFYHGKSPIFTAMWGNMFTFSKHLMQIYDEGFVQPFFGVTKPWKKMGNDLIPTGSKHLSVRQWTLLKRRVASDSYWGLKAYNMRTTAGQTVHICNNLTESLSLEPSERWPNFKKSSGLMVPLLSATPYSSRLPFNQRTGHMKWGTNKAFGLPQICVASSDFMVSCSIPVIQLHLDTFACI